MGKYIKFPLVELASLYDNTVMIFNNYNGVHGFSAFCRQRAIDSMGLAETDLIDSLVSKEHFPLEGYALKCDTVNSHASKRFAKVHLYFSDTIEKMERGQIISPLYEVDDLFVIVMPKKDFLLQRSSGEIRSVFGLYFNLFRIYISAIKSVPVVTVTTLPDFVIAYIFAMLFIDSMLDYKPHQIIPSGVSDSVIAALDIAYKEYSTWRSSSDAINLAENSGCIGTFSVITLAEFISDVVYKVTTSESVTKWL